jgi:hypothetical protein
MVIDAALVSVCHLIGGGSSCTEIESMMIIGGLRSGEPRVRNSRYGRMRKRKGSMNLTNGHWIPNIMKTQLHL